MRTGELRTVSIESILSESRDVWTIRYADGRRALPGQFVMVWVPGVNEVPMSLSYLGKMKGFTFRTVGKTTSVLSLMHSGDRIGVRGIFGNSFAAEEGRVLVAGGGTGIASVVTAVEEFSRDHTVDAAIGAKSADELFFTERIEDAAAETVVTTDDGSAGEKGLVTQAVERMMDKRRYGTLIACGPEKMLYRIAKMAHEKGVEARISVERYMKCGFGICDACSIDGHLACVDGPVFDANVLLSTSDFGRYRLTPSGRRVSI
ncbi:MAG: dihydroorotate dehydrogenase electron transfer subunit [Thermoplasmata archaeon]|uniref:Dihydroorotate dehydrogenase electron transfer subunit n=1 Tax=Candidatus Sysuiplasma superficiale TaxID=2823368 RepID=A0A8J7YNM1_9ARCH|nr:dihydroorotate dehydrogenase electron transfer subunit [Candidatus Sysuiplasma superficiale]MBX8643695.1 dihydroorotate dehydrogenase electron transfer subunit [Candidatus Sysuiplasma superficiale]MCL4347042.1 dihydroorotate dehydrogenase electron transfer subunit [Candidatus Thermoplasmatota archaeon]